MNIPTIEPKVVMKLKTEVWIGPTDDLFEAIPLFTRMSLATETEYKIDIVTESEEPIAYAIYHPSMSDRFIFIAGDALRRKSMKLSEL